MAHLSYFRRTTHRTGNWNEKIVTISDHLHNAYSTACCHLVKVQLATWISVR